MSSQAEKAVRFLSLHRGPTPLLLPNPWDPGSAKVLLRLGFEALATTSGGYAGTLGRLDGSVTRQEALEHAVTVVDAVDVPVSADLENCFADEPEGVAETARLAVGTGLAGFSVEDHRRGDGDAIYPTGLARDRVEAAVEAAHGDGARLVVTARAENYLHGRPDLADTISRLQAFQAAGADVVYAPGITAAADIRSVVASVDVPVNILILPGVPPLAELAGMGVARVSVGSGFARVATAALVTAGRELIGAGTYGWLAGSATGADFARDTFG